MYANRNKAKPINISSLSSKKEQGGKATVENGVNLERDIHSWLHSFECHDIEMYYLINECLLLYKKCLDQNLEELVQDYETEIMPRIEKNWEYTEEGRNQDDKQGTHRTFKKEDIRYYAF